MIWNATISKDFRATNSMIVVENSIEQYVSPDVELGNPSSHEKDYSSTRNRRGRRKRGIQKYMGMARRLSVSYRYL